MIEQKLQSKVQPREVSITSTGRPRKRSARLERAHEVAEGQLTLPAHDERHARGGIGVGLAGQARIVAADHHRRVRAELTQEPDDAQRGVALEGHHRQADQVGPG
jgi:hypothetical protein